MKSLATGNFTEIASNSYTNTFKVTELFKKQQQPLKIQNLQKFLDLKAQQNGALNQSISQQKTKTSFDNSYENFDTINWKTDEDLEFLVEKNNNKIELCQDSPENSIYEETLSDKFFTKLDEYNSSFKIDNEKNKCFEFLDEQLRILLFSQNQSYLYPNCYFKSYPSFNTEQFESIKMFSDYQPNPTSAHFFFQFEFTVLMRAQIIDWLMEVCRDFGLTKFTFSTCVDYMDRFFANVCQNHWNVQLLENKCEIYLITKEDLQLIAAGCAFIASKNEEINQINIAYIQSATAFSYNQQQIINTEIAILKNLQFQLNSQTLNTWLDFIIFYWDMFLGNIKQIAKELKIENYQLCELQKQTIRNNTNPQNFIQLSLALNYLHFDLNAIRNQKFEGCIAILFIYIFHLLQITDEEFQFSLLKSFMKFINPNENNEILKVITIIQNLAQQLNQIFKHNLSIRNSPQNINLFQFEVTFFYQNLKQNQQEQLELFVLQQYYPKLLQFYTENIYEQ